ncbi:MAG: hypothetical protein D6687_02550 [Acidobacteria bacterium]|jgi:hypothetical protein|nr:MAG: hypothetical protein D6687_02550 [Acidobacteriota bacterium]GIU83010.1 MAG: hypothetical protein KatS3mg006_2074 [Pyrinomonadaceae bacterium]
MKKKEKAENVVTKAIKSSRNFFFIWASEKIVSTTRRLKQAKKLFFALLVVGVFSAQKTFLDFAISDFLANTAIENKALAEKAQSNTKIFKEVKPQVFKAVKFAVSDPVSSFGPAQPEEGKSSRKMGRAEEQARKVPNRLPFRKQIQGAIHDVERNFAEISSLPMPSPSLSFEGISSNDNAAAYGFRIIPPDTNGDVGLNHYVQAVNSLVRVFDKQGNPLTPPFKLSSLFSSLGTPCSRRDDGDPIVLYDPLADRWIISQFCILFPPFRQMIAVSKSPDPTGEFYVYEFVMPNVKLNDYPKLAVWTDAIYMSTDQFLGSDYAGSGVFAFNKIKLYSGATDANYIYFDLASPTTIRLGNLLPADLDGLNLPPEGMPGIFVGYTATEYGDPLDAIRLFEFRADFNNPLNSTFAERAESPIPVAPFDPTSPAGRADIQQPPPGEALDSQSDRLMYRVAYRNFGSYDSLVFNQTVRISAVGETYRAGVRVYELRRNSPNSAFQVNFQATIGEIENSRWMASAAQDHQGNIAVGYSFASEQKKPSILYTGRLSTDPPGTFRIETPLVIGTGVQTAFGFRWGDYSQMSIDPSDDCSFWLTNEYYTLESQEESPFGWLTRIGKFRFPECSDAPRAVITGVVTNAENGQPIQSAVIRTLDYFRSTNEFGQYGNLSLLPGTYNLTATARGFRPKSLAVSVSNGQTLIQNFALEPTAVLEIQNVEILSENCVANEAIEPGETVTMNIKLKNTGMKATQNLTASLQSSGGVINQSPPQNYGVLLPNGEGIARPFTFTVSPDLSCGDEITLTLDLRDRTEDLGTVSISLNTGIKRIALQENFDRSENLPVGWTTSASGGQQNWVISSNRQVSPRNSAFSSCSTQIGINQLETPSFPINSTQAELSFKNWYELESTFLRNKLYDGAVLEIKIGDGDWQDIESAGGFFLQGGYDGVIDSCCQNPLAGRRAWSGRSGVNQTAEFVTARVKLPISSAGQNVKLRWRVGTDQGTAREGQYIDDVLVTDGYTCACRLSRKSIFDFDGDGKTDLSVFRPSDSENEPDFYIKQSGSGNLTGAFWGSIGDIAVNADYDGDGRFDFAVFRPSTGTWFILQSATGTILVRNFGLSADRLVPADFDGDGRADLAVFRPSEGNWYISLSGRNGETTTKKFGIQEDLPISGDFDGDGRADIAVFRPSTGFWFILRSSDETLRSIKFGINGDRPITGDFDGDGRADIAVFRPSNGTWYFLASQRGFYSVKFGTENDRILQADFDGDGRADIAVFRNGNWLYLQSSDGTFKNFQFGLPNDIPVPSIFVP